MILELFVFIFGTVIAFLIGLFEVILTKIQIEKIDKIILSFGLGNATVVLILFVINQYLGISLTEVNILISVSSAFLILLILCFLRGLNLFEEITSIFKIKSIKTDKVFIILLILFYLISFYKAMFFPVVNWDSVYGFAYWPKVVWNDHSLPIVSSSYHEVGMAWGNQNFPVLLNNYLFALNNGFDEFFIRILIPLWSIFNLLIIYRLSYMLFKNRIIPMISSVLFVSTNVFTAYSVFTLSPMYVIFYPLLAVYFYILYEKSKERPILITSSILFGIALAMKYTWIPFFLAFIISIMLVKREIKKPIVMTLITAAISLIFYMRNMIYYHNPFFPLYFGGKNYNHFLSGLFWENFMTSDFTNMSLFFDTVFKSGVLIWIFFALFGIFFFKKGSQTEKILYLSLILYIPFFIMNSAFLPATDGQRHILPQLGIMSAFAAMYFWRRVDKPSYKFILIPLITSLVMIPIGVWFNVMGTSLLLLIALPPALITPVLFLHKKEVITKRVMLALVFIFLMITPIGYLSSMKRVSIWEFPSDEEVITRYWDDIYVTAEYINQNLPQDAKILSLENRRYYFERKIIPADHPDMIFDYQKGTDVNEVIEKLDMMGIDYFLVNPLWEDKGFWELSTLHKNIDYLEERGTLERIFKYKNLTLYKIVYV